MTYTDRSSSRINVGPLSFSVSLCDGKWAALHALNKEIVSRNVMFQCNGKMLHFTYRDHYVGDEKLTVVYEVSALPTDPTLELFS